MQSANVRARGGAPRARRWAMYGGQDPREVPTYALAEAARYLRMPLQTLRNWTYGYALDRDRRATPLVRAADIERHLLSFWNVAELHVLDSMRRFHGITPKNLRRLLQHLEDKFQTPHPLINERMLTDGVHVFVESAGKLVNATRDGQLVMRHLLEAHLHRIEQDVDGLATVLFPFVRRKPDPHHASSLDNEPKLVSIDPRVRFGRPVIAGTSIPTWEIASRFRAGDSSEELAEEYGRPRQEIEEAIRCELTLDAAA